MPNKQTEQERKLKENLDDLIGKFGYSLEPIQIIEAFKEAGYVKLAEDQTLPDTVGQCMDCTDSDKLLEAGWRKVDYGDITITEVEYDLEGICKAQLAKASAYYEKKIAELEARIKELKDG